MRGSLNDVTERLGGLAPLAHSPTMLREDQTCPKCGGLVTPQLTRCRQCGHYLHGTALEGLIVDSLLPKAFQAAPGTGLMAIYIIATYLLMLLLAGPGALAGFKPLALLQLGATVSTEVQDLQPWRFLSAVFVHGDILHVLFNLYALSIVGPMVEHLHDRKRLIVFFVVTGALSMASSYLVSTLLLSAPYFAGSVGASGAVSGLLGIAWITTRSPQSEGHSLHSGLTRWVVIMFFWGFLPGIDAIAHAGGFIAGVVIGRFVREGPPERRWMHRAWTGGSVVCMAAVLAASTATLIAARDQPYRLSDDMHGRSLLVIQLESGTPWKTSGQYRALTECAEATSVEPGLDVCELATRVAPWSPVGHAKLAQFLLASGETAAASRQANIAERLAQ